MGSLGTKANTEHLRIPTTIPLWESWQRTWKLWEWQPPSRWTPPRLYLWSFQLGLKPSCRNWDQHYYKNKWQMFCSSYLIRWTWSQSKNIRSLHCTGTTARGVCHWRCLASVNCLFHLFSHSFFFYVPAYCLVQYSWRSGPLFVLASSLDVLLHAAFSKNVSSF